MKLSKFSLNSELVILHNKDWIEQLRFAVLVLSEIMGKLEQLVKEKTTLSLLEIDEFVGSEIKKKDCSPTFFQYKDFPNNCCMSVNKDLVHGIPTNYKLQEGDLISFDFGVTYRNAIADSARTYIYGEPKSKEHIRLIETTKLCLDNAIKSIEVGKHLGVIGNAIYKTARNNNFNIVENYGGHAILGCFDGKNVPHAPPFVSNRANPEIGCRLEEGMVLAIEPLLTPGNPKTYTREDNWTVYCSEVNSHMEDTVVIIDGKIENMTRRKDENNLSR